MVLNKALPSVFVEPSLMRMMKGEIPYRAVLQSMYRDGLVLAGLCALASAGIAQYVRVSVASQASTIITT